MALSEVVIFEAQNSNAFFSASCKVLPEPNLTSVLSPQRCRADLDTLYQITN